MKIDFKGEIRKHLAKFDYADSAIAMIAFGTYGVISVHAHWLMTALITALIGLVVGLMDD